MEKPILIVLIVIVLFTLSCRPEAETKDQNESNSMNSLQTNNENKSTEQEVTTRKNEKITNIKDSLKFNDEKPAILSIISSDKLNLKVVGLKKGQIMSKHKASLKSLVIVLEGKIELTIDNEKFELDQLDTYEIPVNVEHEIRGIEQSVFSLTQEK